MNDSFISITELKALFGEASNHYHQEQQSYKSDDYYKFECKNSADIRLDKHYKLRGLLCLHSKNFKTILIDAADRISFGCDAVSSDWIYVEFINCPDYSNSPLHLLFRHFLVEIELSYFNVVRETFRFDDNQQQHASVVKQVFHIQADLKESNLFIQDTYDNDDDVCGGAIQATQRQLQKKKKFLHEFLADRLSAESVDFHFMKMSVLKSAELEKIFFKLDPIVMSLIDRMANLLNSNDNETNNQQLKEFLDRKYSNKIVYMFKLKSKGSVYTTPLATQQIRVKLRADCLIELIDVFQFKAMKQTILLVLVDKSLFYYNFLHLNNFYLLILNNETSSSSSSCSLNSIRLPNGIMFINEHEHTIIDQQTIVDAIGKHDQLFARFNRAAHQISDSSPLNQISGRLLEKRIVKSYLSASTSFKKNLMDQFDILFSNRTYRLVIKTDDSSIITVFFDTKCALHHLSILPGLQVSMLNLSKRLNDTFHGTVNLTVDFEQPFNFISHLAISDPIEDSYSSTNKITYKNQPSVDFLLYALDFAFTKIYSNNPNNQPQQQHQQTRLKSLFCSNSSGSFDNSMCTLGQLTKFYYLTLKLFCVDCKLFATYCRCFNKQTKTIENNGYRLEMSASFQLDDHTSIIRVNYENSNASGFKSKESNFFQPIAGYLFQVMRDHQSEIKLPNVPVNLMSNSASVQENQDAKQAAVLNAIRERYQHESQQHDEMTAATAAAAAATTTMSICERSNSTVCDNEATTAKNSVHISKTLYDYFLYCILDKYFLVYLDRDKLFRTTNSLGLVRKSLYRLANLKHKEQAEQFKSQETLDCLRFTSIDEISLDENND